MHAQNQYLILRKQPFYTHTTFELFKALSWSWKAMFFISRLKISFDSCFKLKIVLNFVENLETHWHVEQKSLKDTFTYALACFTYDSLTTGSCFSNGDGAYEPPTVVIVRCLQSYCRNSSLWSSSIERTEEANEEVMWNESESQPAHSRLYNKRLKSSQGALFS